MEVLHQVPLKMSSGMTFEPGVVGSAFRFDGHWGSCSLPDAPNLRLPASLTVVCWARVDTPFVVQPTGVPNPRYSFLAGKGDGGCQTRNYGLYFDRVEGSLHFNAADVSGDRYVFDANVPYACYFFTDGGWHFVAATGNRDLQVATVIVDGRLVTQATGTDDDLATNAYPLTIGAGSEISDYLKGGVDELMIFSGPLTFEEIVKIYRAGPAGCAR